MFAADISGIVYDDLTGNGLTPDDVPLGGAQVDLFADTNNNGAYDNGVDLLVDSDLTAPGTGLYVFPNIADGKYFIRQNLAAGETQTFGPAVYAVEVAGTSVLSGNRIVIDDFNAPARDTFLINLLDNDPLLVKQAAGAGLVGGERDVLIDVSGASLANSASGHVGGGSVLIATGGPTGTTTSLQYDGVDNTDTAAGLVDSKLLNLDLTAAGQNNGLRFDFLYVDGGINGLINLNIVITDTTGGTATLNKTIATNNTPFSSFYEFTDAGWVFANGFTLADFSAVASINVVFNGTPGVEADDEFELDMISADRNSFNFARFDAQATSSLGGIVFKDCADNDGIQDPGDVGIPNVQIRLDRFVNGVYEVVGTTTTGADGSYLFTGLVPGRYRITEVSAEGVAGSPLEGFFDGKDVYTPIGAALPMGPQADDVYTDIDLPANFTGLNFNFAEIGPSSITGFVYIDVNNDGAKGPQESPIEGVKITLTGTNDLGPIAPVVVYTNAQGLYTFANLRPGTYNVTETQPGIYVDGKDSSIHVNGAQTNDVHSGINLAGCTVLENNNFGEFGLIVPSKRPFIFVNGAFNNPVNAVDVNADGQVDPQDLLIVVEAFEKLGLGQLPANNPGNNFPDINGNGQLDPADLLAAVEALNVIRKFAPGANVAAAPVAAGGLLADRAVVELAADSEGDEVVAPNARAVPDEDDDELVSDQFAADIAFALASTAKTSSQVDDDLYIPINA